MVWGKAGSTTLESAGDVITSSGMTASNFNMVLTHQIATGNLDNIDVTLNNNTNQVYADRESTNGGSEYLQNTQPAWRMSHGNASWDYFNVNYICSITGEEKLLIAQFTSNNGEGNTAPNKNEQVAKFVPNPDAPVTRIDFTNTSGSGSYDTGSNLSALGSDITPASAIPFPTNVQVGSRAEITDTRKMYNLIEEKYEDDLSTDKGWVSSYSTKMAYNGTTDKLDLNFENELNNANITIVKELDFTLGTKFVVRFVLDFSQFGGVPFITMGVSDKDSTVNADTAQDYLGIVCHNGTTWSAQVKDNTELGTFTNINQASYSGHQSGFGTDFYCELIRNENSFTINIRTGSHTGTSVVTATTTISTIGTVSNLKYIKFGNYDGTSSGGYCATTIDDLLVYNGVTSPSSTPSKSWKEIGA